MGVDGYENILILGNRGRFDRISLEDFDRPRLYANYYVLHDFWGNYNQKKYHLKKYIMKGRTGTHELSADVTNRKRLQAHWEGFCQNNGFAPEPFPKRLPRKSFFKKFHTDRFL